MLTLTDARLCCICFMSQAWFFAIVSDAVLVEVDRSVSPGLDADTEIGTTAELARLKGVATAIEQ